MWDARVDAALNPRPTLERLKQLGQGNGPTATDPARRLRIRRTRAYHAHPYPCRERGVVRSGAAKALTAALNLRVAEASVVTAEGITRVLRPRKPMSSCSVPKKPLPRCSKRSSRYIPAAETGHQDRLFWLRQEIPGDLDWAGMSFAACAAGDGGAIAVVTSLESDDPLSAATTLARGVYETG